MRVRTLVAATLTTVLAGISAAQDNAADAARLIEVLQLGPASTVADIGAGPEGLLTIPIARQVGRVYATEIGEKALTRLRAAIQQAGLQNVEVIDGDPRRTNLAASCCDGIFIRNVYHHFADPPAMNRSLLEAVKPNGRLAVLDFQPRGGREASSPDGRATGDQHGVTPDTVARELQEAGFKLETSESRPDRWFLLVVRRP
jgi:ubiquinone/menaquinone biosynthesis C-methylase UbiE